MQRALLRVTLALVLGAFGLALPEWAEAKPTTPGKNKSAAAYHTVYQGQTLGMIAKRYNVSVEALCSANAISRRTPIKPGQKLVLPGSNASIGAPGPAPHNSARVVNPANPAHANITKVSTLAPTSARPSTSGPGASNGSQRGASWKKFMRPARRAGYVTLRATGRRWEGYAIVKGNRLSSAAQLGFKRALYSWRTGAEVPVDPRLIRLLVKVSDTFGGRPLRVVSGFRENSFSKASKHKRGQACDFSVEGVPNEVLRDFLLTLDQVGVGYYPNSSFVHLDVRPQNNHWVDRSSPGERPEYEHDDD